MRCQFALEPRVSPEPPPEPVQLRGLAPAQAPKLPLEERLVRQRQARVLKWAQAMGLVRALWRLERAVRRIS